MKTFFPSLGWRFAFGFSALCLLMTDVAVFGQTSAPLMLPARQRVKDTNGNYAVAMQQLQWDAKKTAIVVCDMWDQHWCKGATKRVGEMAPRMNAVIQAARAKGVLIIHSPSDTMKFYEGSVGRKLAQAAPPATPRVPLQNWCSLEKSVEGELPIDDSDGGCDDWPRCKEGGPWRQQIAAIEIKEGDAITDSAEAYYLMQQRGIENVIVMGVHLNMCVLGRPFSIRQMVKQGKHVVLMRDMTDTMYNSRMRPQVSHFAGTDLMIEHVEKFWCPTITSTAFLGGQLFRFPDDKRPKVAFMISEDEYDTEMTLPEFATKELLPREIYFTFIASTDADKNTMLALNTLKDADALVVSVRRRALPKEQLAAVRDYIASGKPVVGIRTASHAFESREKNIPAERNWPGFDTEVLGGDYQDHYGKGAVTIANIATNHPVLNGVAKEFKALSHLYKSRNLAPTTTVLMTGHVDGQKDIEPIAWINQRGEQRVFYTSLGGQEDFQEPAFRRLLLNGIFWSLQKPIPVVQ